VKNLHLVMEYAKGGEESCPSKGDPCIGSCHKLGQCNTACLL